MCGSVFKFVYVYVDDGWVIVCGVRSVYFSLYYLFWLPHAYFSSRQCVAQWRTNFSLHTFGWAQQIRLHKGKQIWRVLRALWLGLVNGAGACGRGSVGRVAAHKVTPHLTENHIKTR